MSIKLQFYISKNKSTLMDFCQQIGITRHSQLSDYCRQHGIECDVTAKEFKDALPQPVEEKVETKSKNRVEKSDAKTENSEQQPESAKKATTRRRGRKPKSDGSGTANTKNNP